MERTNEEKTRKEKGEREKINSIIIDISSSSSLSCILRRRCRRRLRHYFSQLYSTCNNIIVLFGLCHDNYFCFCFKCCCLMCGREQTLSLSLVCSFKHAHTHTQTIIACYFIVVFVFVANYDGDCNQLSLLRLLLFYNIIRYIIVYINIFKKNTQCSRRIHMTTPQKHSLVFLVYTSIHILYYFIVFFIFFY